MVVDALIWIAAPFMSRRLMMTLFRQTQMCYTWNHNRKRGMSYIWIGYIILTSNIAASLSQYETNTLLHDALDSLNCSCQSTMCSYWPLREAYAIRTPFTKMIDYLSLPSPWPGTFEQRHSPFFGEARQYELQTRRNGERAEPRKSQRATKTVRTAKHAHIVQ